LLLTTARALERYAALDSLRDVVGIHLRRGDKLVNESNSQMDETEEEWQAQALLAEKYARQIVTAGYSSFYIASEDAVVRTAFVRHIHSLCGTVLNEDMPSTLTLGASGAAVVDMFRLGACKAIMLVARYSGFTFAASLLQNAPVFVLGNFIPVHQKWGDVAAIISLNGTSAATQDMLAALQRRAAHPSV
jgi:hypothetical protein